MPRLGLRGLVIVVAFGSLLPVAGCGDADTGTSVKVDKGKDEKLQKAMGDYMNNQPKPKAH